MISANGEAPAGTLHGGNNEKPQTQKGSSGTSTTPKEEETTSTYPFMSPKDCGEEGLPEYTQPENEKAGGIAYGNTAAQGDIPWHVSSKFNCV